MLHMGECINDCPRFYMANFSATECYPLSNLDATLIYFPFLWITLVVFGFSYVGYKQKKKHLLIPNFLVFMGIIEHIVLFTQVILTIKYATWKYFACSLFVWLAYVASNIIFVVRHYKLVATQDRKYMGWRNSENNRWMR
jgi:hypothetical protein